jgi:predicted RNase H-like HicB family nuclease
MKDGCGRLREIPGVFSQGETLDQLEANIQDAYRLMLEDSETSRIEGINSKEIAVET